MRPILSRKPGFRLVPALFCLVSAALPADASAQDTTAPEEPESAAPPAQSPGTTTTTTVIVREKDKREYSYSFLKPSVGGIFYEREGVDFERLALGFLIEPNLANSDEIILGPVLGLVYSSIDDQGTAELDDNDFIMQFPAQLKVAWVPNGAAKLAIGAHGGVNMIYSQANAFGDTTDDDRFNAYANVGGDLDFRIARSLVIGVRPDWTFLNDFDLFTFTVGLGVAL